MFQEVYNLFGLNPEQCEMALVFFFYDSDKDGFLDRENMVRMFAPRDERYKDLVLQRKSFNEDYCFHRQHCFLPDTMQQLCRLLSLIIDTEVRVNNLKRSLIERKNFDVEKAYLACGGSVDKGFSRINPEKLSKFLISHNFVANDRQVGWLFERFDRFKNGEIVNEDFKKALSIFKH